MKSLISGSSATRLHVVLTTGIMAAALIASPSPSAVAESSRSDSARASKQWTVAWGWDAQGTPPAAQSGVRAIARTGHHTLALLTSGQVVAWGTNSDGESDVPPEAQSGVSAIATGKGFSVAVKNGRVLVWGNDWFNQLFVPSEATSGIRDVAAGVRHWLALTGDGRVVTSEPPAYAPEVMPEAWVPEEARANIAAIGAGSGYSMALTNDGRVITWGCREGEECSKIAPVPQEARSGVDAISAGLFHALAIKDGGVIAWPIYDSGDDYGQTRVPKAARAGIVAVSAGWMHSLALTREGRVIAWGDNSYDQSRVPSQTQSGVTAIAAGANASLALRSTAPRFPSLRASCQRALVDGFPGVACTGVASNVKPGTRLSPRFCYLSGGIRYCTWTDGQYVRVGQSGRFTWREALPGYKTVWFYFRLGCEKCEDWGGSVTLSNEVRVKLN